jgi:hypothetical protein
MKKAVIIILGILLVLLGAAFILPIVYKDKIRAKVEQEISRKVDAQVYFNDFGVSLFRHFPNLTASLDNFGVVGKGVFRGDTLASARSFQISVNLMSVIRGEKIKVKALDLESPRILVKVLKDGRANYDIYIPDTTATTAETDTAQSQFALQVDEWSIRNGYVVYDDRSTPMFARLVNLNHSGSGDFTQDIFDLTTQTTTDALTFRFDGIEYMNKKAVAADVTLNMNLPESKYTFRNNNFKINDFDFGVDGWVALPDTINTNMDLAFKAKENTFKSLLSLVPGVYTKDFEDLKADGNVAFDGFAKGTYSEKQMPGFGLNVLVKNGTMKYTSLPTAVNNINVDVSVNNPDGDLEKTVVNIKQFHADLGKNPVDGRVLVKGFTNYDIDANVKARLNLAELTQMFPMEGLTLKGLYNLDLKAKGIYSEAQKRLPAINAVMSLANGYVKSKDFPAPIEQLNFNATVNDATGQMADAKITIPAFRMVLEGEPLSATAYIENLDDYHWDAKVKGGLNLTKITKIYPLEDMTVTGHLVMDIDTKGKMSDVEAERYESLTTSGTMQVEDLTYTSPDLPQGMRITRANMNFTPKQINISSFDGFLGKSDVSVSGSVSNYMAYLFRENQTLRGDMAFNSRKFDVNEWMVEDPNAPKTADAPLTVVEIPKTIDFTLVSTIDKVLYDNMTLDDMKGTVVVRDGAVRMDQVAFNSLGGSFVTNGTYDSKNTAKPLFDFDLKMTNVSVQEAYKTFNTVKALMPMAQYLQGNVSTDFKIGGLLAQDMMPVYSSLTGGGVIKILQAVLKDAPVLAAVERVTRLNDLSPAQLRDIIMKAEVKDGRIAFQPFDVKIANYAMNIGGSNGLDGSLDYKVKLDIPAGAVGAQVNNALAQLTGKQTANAETITLNLNVGGTHKQPKVGLAGSSTGGTVQETVKEAVKERVTAEVDKARAEAEERARAEGEKLKAEAEAKVKAEQDRLKAEAEKKQQELEQKAREAEERAKEEGRKKLDTEKNKLRDRFLKQKPAPAPPPQPADTAQK